MFPHLPPPREPAPPSESTTPSEPPAARPPEQPSGPPRWTGPQGALKTFFTLAGIVGVLAAWKALDPTPEQLIRYGPPIGSVVGLLIYFFRRRRLDGQPREQGERRVPR